VASIDLGVAYELGQPELAELSNALQDITGQLPEKHQVASFAGPNEVVQLLLNAATWQNALSALAAIFGGAFVAELGKLSAGDIWKNKENFSEALRRVANSKFFRVVSAIQALRKKNIIVTVAVQVKNTPRNAGLIIVSDDPAEIGWQIANIARCAEDIQRIVQRVQAAGGVNYNLPPGIGNEDISIKVEVLENGDVRVLGVTIQKD
jgi:hypothetical protein